MSKHAPPKTIYLQYYCEDGFDYEAGEPIPSTELNSEPSWCVDKIHMSDVEYVRADVQADLLAALKNLVAIIDAAGLLQLSNAVQLGATSWYVKASDRMDVAQAVIAKAKGIAGSGEE